MFDNKGLIRVEFWWNCLKASWFMTTLFVCLRKSCLKHRAAAAGKGLAKTLWGLLKGLYIDRAKIQLKNQILKLFSSWLLVTVIPRLKVHQKKSGDSSYWWEEMIFIFTTSDTTTSHWLYHTSHSQLWLSAGVKNDTKISDSGMYFTFLIIKLYKMLHVESN